MCRNNGSELHREKTPATNKNKLSVNHMREENKIENQMIAHVVIIKSLLGAVIDQLINLIFMKIFNYSLYHFHIVTRKDHFFYFMFL